MKRSFLTVFAATSFIALGACGGDAEDETIEPVEQIEAPAPAPVAPMPDTMMGDTMMMPDTMAGDTM